jgi:heme a synthase
VKQFEHTNKLISNWLLLGVAMLIIQILLGGITRLTGSGLSITEWQPIMGTLPPLNNTDWMLAFEKYKSTGQYRYLNADFTLANFKFIFFWEWLHRNWAKFMGFVFVIPLIYFLLKKYLSIKSLLPFVLIFVVAAMQGLIGWLMVASGLNPESIYVSHIKLALHFMSALVLTCMVYWLALSYKSRDPFSLQWNKKTFLFALVILLLLSIQLTFGAFMAGLKAATAASTWPSINGVYFPDTLWNKSWTGNMINIHFIHRNLAYVIVALITVWTFFISNKNISADLWKAKKNTFGLVIIQLLLGIGSVLFSTKQIKNGMGIFEITAQLHQLVAILLLLSLIRIIFLSKPTKW